LVLLALAARLASRRLAEALLGKAHAGALRLLGRWCMAAAVAAAALDRLRPPVVVGADHNPVV